MKVERPTPRVRYLRGASYSRGSSLHAPPSDPIGPAVTITGAATFGTSSTSPAARSNRLVQVVNNLSHQAGAHALRAGLDLLYNDDRIMFPRAGRGAYTFSSLPKFLSGTYNTRASPRPSARRKWNSTTPTLAPCRVEQRVLQPQLKGQPHVPAGAAAPGRRRDRRLQPDEPRERGDAEYGVRHGPVSDESAAGVRPGHRCGRTAISSGQRTRQVLGGKSNGVEWPGKRG